MSQRLKLIVGIGNPGSQYADTRHNVGVWFLERLADRQGVSFKEEKKFFGRVASTLMLGSELRLLIPTTYMNESGKAVGALAHFYRVAPAEILVAHDELDLPTGVVRYKEGGGLAGHNGLRSITAALGGDQSFNRLRIGVGHPGDKSGVLGHVLGKASSRDRETINICIDEAIHFLPQVVEGNIEQAMNSLNGFRAPDTA